MEQQSCFNFQSFYNFTNYSTRAKYNQSNHGNAKRMLSSCLICQIRRLYHVMTSLHVRLWTQRGQRLLQLPIPLQQQRQERPIHFDDNPHLFQLHHRCILMRKRPRFLHRVAGLACIAKRLDDGPASQSLGRRVGNYFWNSGPWLRLLRSLRWSRLQFCNPYQYRQPALFAFSTVH